MQALRTVWAREPVVCFSIALGTLGLAIPFFVPPLWGKYPDRIAEDKRAEEVLRAAKAARASAGAFSI